MFTIKIVSGLSNGLKLESLKNENLRPTKDRVKESLFDILQFEIRNKVFLDLFGGTGQIGIEAFSRSAAKIIITELKKENFNIIKRNVSKIKPPHDNIEIIKTDAVEFLKSTKIVPDIAFLDPPYASENLLGVSLEETAKIINRCGIIITETLSSQNVQNSAGDFSLQKRYKYGNISLNLYKKAISQST